MLKHNSGFGDSTVSQHLPFYEELLENIDDVLITTDNNFIITYWNKAAERIYNVPAAQALGLKIREVIPYDFLGSSNEAAIAQLQISNKWKGVVKYTRDDLEEVYLQCSVSRVKNEAGEVTGIIALNRDVTQQYLAERSLTNFTAILGFLDESFLVFDNNLLVVYENQTQNLRALYQSDYRKGDHLLTYIPDALKAGVLEKYKRALAGESFSNLLESEGDPAAKVYMNVTYMPIKNVYNIVTHVAVIIKDLTEEKRAALIEQKRREEQEQLLESRMLFEEFMENCPLPAWITDEAGVKQYMNPKRLETWHLSKADIGKNMESLFDKTIADSHFEKNKVVLTSNKAIEYVETLPEADGSTSTFLSTRFPILYKGKPMVGGWATNITEQKKIQQKLEETNDYKDKIMSVIGHDLRAPLTVVSSLIGLIAEEADELSKEELLESFNHLKISNDKALQLLHELLMWGQSRTNHINFEPKPTDVPALIQSSVAYLQEQLHEKHIAVTYNLQQETIAFADSNMLKTIFRNFVTNAIKFSPEHSTITVSARVEGNDIRISVADEGVGMNDAMKSMILSGRNAVSTFGTRGEKGMGIGLSICKDFIANNKGVMRIENNAGQGTIFSFSLPKFVFTSDVLIPNHNSHSHALEMKLEA